MVKDEIRTDKQQWKLINPVMRQQLVQIWKNWVVQHTGNPVTKQSLTTLPRYNKHFGFQPPDTTSNKMSFQSPWQLLKWVSTVGMIWNSILESSPLSSLSLALIWDDWDDCRLKLFVFENNMVVFKSCKKLNDTLFTKLIIIPRSK